MKRKSEVYPCHENTWPREVKSLKNLLAYAQILLSKSMLLCTSNKNVEIWFTPRKQEMLLRDISSEL